MTDNPTLAEGQDFDSFASEQLRDLMGEIRVAQGAGKLVPVEHALRSFATRFNQLSGQMEGAYGQFQHTFNR